MVCQFAKYLLDLFATLANDLAVVLLLDLNLLSDARNQIVDVLLDHHDCLIDAVARALDLDNVADFFTLLNC